MESDGGSGIWRADFLTRRVILAGSRMCDMCILKIRKNVNLATQCTDRTDLNFRLQSINANILFIHEETFFFNTAALHCCSLLYLISIQSFLLLLIGTTER